MKVHPESARMFQMDEEVEKAKSVAYRLLSGKSYTRQEILRKLRGRRFSNRAIQETLAVLERVGLIDDVDFARRWVEERMRLRPMGRPMLARELKRRGVAEDIVARVLDETLAEVDPESVALELLRGRRERYRGLERRKSLSRMYGFLARRGFGAAVSHDAAERAWGELEDSEEQG